MCPVASVPIAAELDEYATDVDICKSLTQLKSGCSLPKSILSDLDPYQFTPSNLPGWYPCHVISLFSTRTYL